MTDFAVHEVSPRPPVPLSPKMSAEKTLTLPQKVVGTAFTLISIPAVVLWGWETLLFVVIVFINIVYIDNLLLSLKLFRGSLTRGLTTFKQEELREISDFSLPAYSIIIPLFKEGEKKTNGHGEITRDGEKSIIQPLIGHLKNLDYPHLKKDIIFLLEEEDQETIEVIKRQIWLSGIADISRVVVLPSAFENYLDTKTIRIAGIRLAIFRKMRRRKTVWYPQTKPKACNVGLSLARGKYTVIYDAEDAPERDQLRKAIAAFRKASPKTICVQAKLEFRNPRSNWLSRMFAGEYATYFNEFLPGLAASNLPVPLGGTSNHFVTETLREIGGWDSFNVTEDIDLGMRIARNGYRVGIIDSTTWEEANTKLLSWISQRTRWYKGRIQTWLVAMRNPFKLFSDLGAGGFLRFQTLIGGPILMLLFNPVFWGMTILYAITEMSMIRQLYPSPLLYLAIFSVTIGNIVFIGYVATGCMIRGLYTNVWRTFLTVPFYWALMSIAMYKAVWQIFFKPHYWGLTTHGLDTTGVVFDEESLAFRGSSNSLRSDPVVQE